ncbi:hypothetical protein [Paenibacillus sp. Y412MC10]|uniref:hypothetical protein n=1 Tax=Geobacillus sp. (strain Y412MC10) TaxID=481743 RepID=UPI0011A072C5|nr:hypothetical protein [Paenibacillus sp. Y412MC10]
MQWKISEAKPEDFDAINDLVGQLYSIHAKNRPDIYRPCDKPLDYDYYISMLNDDNVKQFSSIELHVAEFNEDAIGLYEAKGFKPRSRTLELPIV